MNICEVFLAMKLRGDKNYKFKRDKDINWYYRLAEDGESEVWEFTSEDLLALDWTLEETEMVFDGL